MTTAAESDFLLTMAAASRTRDAAARARLSDAQQRSQLVSMEAPHGLYIQPNSFDLIAELKRRSPAEGELNTDIAPEKQAAAYIEGGCAALSVLTEPERFSGSLDDLALVARTTKVPAMRKDFLVSRYQVREARLAGASGVLLIAAMLDRDQLKAMLEATFELGMFALMEVFDTVDLDKCVPVLESFGPALDEGRCNYMLGVNCRDLRSLQVDFNHFSAMAPHLPDTMPLVAESGLTEPAHVEVVAGLGYSLALVGSALMRSGDPAATVADFCAAGRATCS